MDLLAITTITPPKIILNSKYLPCNLKMHWYSIIMGIKNFLRQECNRIIQEEFIETKFADYGEGLVTAISRYSIAGKFGKRALIELLAKQSLANNNQPVGY